LSSFRLYTHVIICDSNLNIFEEITFIGKNKGARNMTICIGAICEENKVVVVADRMLTNQNLSIEFEHEKSKIIELSNNCVAVVAGSAIGPKEILEPVVSEYKSVKTPTIYQIVQKIAENYRRFRLEKAESYIFIPRGLTLQYFYANQNGLNEALVRGLDTALERFDLQIEIMIVGVDNTGGHIYLITNPGNVDCLDTIGWCSIGSGSPHADNSLIASGYHPNVPLKKALYLLYEAKKRAEVAPGVGKRFTDIVYIDNDGIHKLSEYDIKKLDEIFEEKESLIMSKSKEIEKKIDNLLEENHS
jgi:20S proteasome alpha/beta subunit